MPRHTSPRISCERHGSIIIILHGKVVWIILTEHVRENPSVTIGFPLQRASQTQRVSMPWRHLGVITWALDCLKSPITRPLVCDLVVSRQRVLWDRTGILSLHVSFHLFCVIFPFCPSSLIFDWLNIFHLIFWMFSYNKTQILYLFFFILARVDLFSYVNFWSCLWVHWVHYFFTGFVGVCTLMSPERPLNLITRSP